MSILTILKGIFTMYIYIHIPYQKLILQTEGIPGSPVGTAFRPAMFVGL